MGLAEDLDLAGRKRIERPDGTAFDVRGLRILKDDILPNYLSRPSRDDTRCLSFLLMILCDDIFYNFAGDFPYEEPYGKKVDAIRTEFFLSLGDRLCELSRAVAGDDFVQVFQLLTSLVLTYLDSLDRINQEIDRSEDRLNDRGQA